MVKKEETVIEEKKKLREEGIDKKNENQWVDFCISIVINIIITLVIGILGANFIYLTTAENAKQDGDTLLEYLFPTSDAKYAPTPITTGGARCSKTMGYNTNFSLLKKIGIGASNSWPYNMYKTIDKNDKNDKHNTYSQLFKNWFAESIADSYKTNRSLLQQCLKLFSLSKEGAEENIFSNETFQMFIVSPLTFLVFPLTIFFTYCCSWFSMFKMGWGFTLIGAFLIYSWLISFSVSFAQTVQYLFTFTLLPLFADIKRVRKIFGCNAKALSIFFGILVCSSAVSYLDTTISITMFVVYLLMLIKSYW